MSGVNPAPEGQAFRPDLEGFRAVAVGLVLAYHVGLPLFTGGYIGVDVFFVLSGFLITGLIVRELQATGTVSLSTFYARRARRLLPASALVLVATVLASWAFLPALLVGDIARDAAAAALYVSNLRFAWQATDYLAAEVAPSPLLHYWSLGVEEQFYLVWPALLLVATAGARRSLTRLAVVVAVVGVGSFAASLIVTGISTPWAFYSLPTRAWELALGGGVALAAARGLALPRPVGMLTAAVGLGMVVLAGLLFDTSTPFPGVAAVLPTVGAAMVIAAGVRGATGPVASLLSMAPVRWIGRISYSLYLWHWPVLVIPAAALGDELPLAVRLLLGLVAVVLAALTQRWVEEPLRQGRFVGRRPRPNLALAGLLTVAVAGGSLAVGQVATSTLAVGEAPVDVGGIEDVLGTPRPSQPGPSVSPTAAASPAPATPTAPASAGPQPVPDDLQPPLALAREDLPVIYSDGCQIETSETTSPPCEYGDLNGATTIALLGDSKAAQWFPALERLARERGWRLLSLTKVNCAAVDGEVWVERLKRDYPECVAWRSAALERIAAANPALVVVANSKSARLAVDGAADPEGQGAAWDAALGRMLEGLDAVADDVVLLGDTPQHDVDPPVCLSANLADAGACSTPQDVAVPFERLAADRVVADAADASFIDPTAWVCPTDPCPLVIGNVLTYHDAGHITRTFSSALAPYLAGALPAVEGAAEVEQ